MKPNTHSAKLVVASSQGLRARTAAMLVKVARGFEAEILVQCDHKEANAKSIVSILSLCVAKGIEVTVTARGRDAREAIQAMKNLFGRFPNE
jgi:phosphotransferase system HPr (HPr) family protein